LSAVLFYIKWHIGAMHHHFLWRILNV
jgi:hypothetical protein